MSDITELVEQIEESFCYLQKVIDSEESDEIKRKLIQFKRNKNIKYTHLISSLQSLLEELDDYNNY
jgi:hypothetical protein